MKLVILLIFAHFLLVLLEVLFNFGTLRGSFAFLQVVNLCPTSLNAFLFQFYLSLVLATLFPLSFVELVLLASQFGV